MLASARARAPRRYVGEGLGLVGPDPDPAKRRELIKMELRGVEPLTSRLRTVRSNQLSYSPKVTISIKNRCYSNEIESKNNAHFKPIFWLISWSYEAAASHINSKIDFSVNAKFRSFIKLPIISSYPYEK